MTVYDRLVMELGGQEYLSSTQLNQLLSENNLTADDTYDKSEMQKKLLLTVMDVFDALMNDVDLMQDLTTEFGSSSKAIQYISARLLQVRDKIASIPDPDEDVSQFSLMFTRGGSKTYGGYIKPINTDTIDKIISEEFKSNE